MLCTDILHRHEIKKLHGTQDHEQIQYILQYIFVAAILLVDPSYVVTFNFTATASLYSNVTYYKLHILHFFLFPQSKPKGISGRSVGSIFALLACKIYLCSVNCCDMLEVAVYCMS